MPAHRCQDRQLRQTHKQTLWVLWVLTCALLLLLLPCYRAALCGPAVAQHS
jgi:hypothetical protein